MPMKGKAGMRMKRWVVRLALLVWLLLCLQPVALAVAFGAEGDTACRPGKTVSLYVYMQEPGDTAAFLVTAESDGLTFVRAEAVGEAKEGYTRCYGEGGRGAFVYTARSGSAGFSGNVVRFVFSAPETPGEYTVTMRVSQVCRADGTMTEETSTSTLLVTVTPEAPDTPAAGEVSSIGVESGEEPAGSRAGSAASPGGTTVLEALAVKGNGGFWLGAGCMLLVFALGVGVYVLLAHPKEPPRHGK